MSGLLEMPGDAVADRLLSLTADLVALISDKGGAQQRLKDLAKATREAEQLIEQATAASKASDERLAGVERELAEHADAMLRDRQVLQRERDQFGKERKALLDEASKLRDQAQHDSDMAATKLKELNAKLAAISQAAAA